MAGASGAAGAVDLGEPVVPVAQAGPAESKSRSSRYADMVNRGEALLSKAKPDIPAAIRLLEQAVALNPDKPAAHMNLAIAHQRSDRHIEASLAFLAAMERYPESTEKWFVTLAARIDPCPNYTTHLHAARWNEPPHKSVLLPWQVPRRACGLRLALLCRAGAAVPRPGRAVL